MNFNQAGRTEDGDESKGLELKRRVGLFSGVALIVGNMIGNFIYYRPTNDNQLLFF